MNKNTIIAVVLGLLIIGGIGYFLYTQTAKAPAVPEEVVATTTPDATAPRAQAPARSYAATDFSWSFNEVGETDFNAPLTRVTLTAGGKAYDAGTHVGSCQTIEASALTTGELAGALCWFAGAGDELGVFMENGRYVLKVGEQGEPTGESAAFRGNFKTLLTLD